MTKKTRRAIKRPTWNQWVCDKLRQLIVDIERGDADMTNIDVRNYFDPAAQSIDFAVYCRVPLIHGAEDHPRTERLPGRASARQRHETKSKGRAAHRISR